jgi:DNA-directed RNA polymerase subunit RPC12/RpoP
MVPLNKTYAEYKCQDCGRRHTDRDLRSRISTEQRIELFKNVRGIEMHSPKEMHEVDDQYAMRNSSGLSDWDVMYSIISKKFFTRGIDDPY